MTTINKLLAGLCIAGAGLAVSSCADDLDLTPENSFTAGNFWKTQGQFEGNLTAMMNQFRSNYDYNFMFAAAELRSGIICPNAETTDGSSYNSGDVPYMYNNIDEQHCQFTNFMNLYGFISNCNTFLYYDEKQGDVMEDGCRNYLEGMIYGMRAWAYFQIHRVYGTGPLRLGSEVIEGEYDPMKLKCPRSTASELIAQIQSDITASEEHFAKAGSYAAAPFKVNGSGSYYWNPDATQVLAGEFHMWIAKVSTGDHTATGQPDIAKAKQHFENVLRKGYTLMPTYEDAINYKRNNANATSTENIFASYYGYGEATNGWYWNMSWSNTTGLSKGQYWQNVSADGTSLTKGASRQGYIYNPNTPGQLGSYTTFFTEKMNYVMRQQYKNAVYFQYDTAHDYRSRQLQPTYVVTAEESQNNVYYIPDFKPEEREMAAVYTWKYHGKLMPGQTSVSAINDMVYYRLPLVYFYMAEIANYEGNNRDVEKYINLVRQRAYGDRWDESLKYVAGDFGENEVAILQEKTKEFLWEGQRWWDLRRLSLKKDGKDRDHLIFQPQGCVGYGLDVAAHPNWHEVLNKGNWPAIVTDEPVLDYATKKHMVLWPLNVALLNSDISLKQTPGYETIAVDENGSPRSEPFIEH